MSDQDQLLLELARLAAKSTEKDHVGDLIKIGLPILGAIIGALIGLFAAKRTAETQRQTTLDVARENHRTELTKELGNRRALRFDDLLGKFDLFCQRLTTYTTAVANALETGGVGAVSAERLAAIEKCDAEFSAAFLDLVNAESKLLVMGHADDLHQQFREFGESAQKLYKFAHIRNPALTVAEIDSRMAALRNLRKNLLVRIGDEERKWWQA